MFGDLRVGVIGTGAIGQSHIERIAKQLKGAGVTACYDYNQDLSQRTATEFNLKSYSDGEELIASPEVDVIIVATIDAVHEKYVLSAIKNRKYVLCEKPLAPEPQACRRIVEAEMAAGKRFVQVGFMRRYDPGYKQLKALIERQTYGAPLIVHCAHRNKLSPHFTTEMSVENSMIHEIDVLRWILDEDYTKAEVVFPRKTSLIGEQMQDPQILYLTTQSGIRIDIESFVNCQYGYDIKCEIVCESGTLNLPEPSNAMIRANASRITPICSDWSERFIDAYNYELQEWINSCQHETVSGPSSWDGYIGQTTAKAASRSRDENRPVDVKIEDRPDFYKIK